MTKEESIEILLNCINMTKAEFEAREKELGEKEYKSNYEDDFFEVFLNGGELD